MFLCEEKLSVFVLYLFEIERHIWDSLFRQTNAYNLDIYYTSGNQTTTIASNLGFALA